MIPQRAIELEKPWQFRKGSIPTNKGRKTVRKCDSCSTTSHRVILYKRYQRQLCDRHYAQLQNHGRILWDVRPLKTPEPRRLKHTLLGKEWRKKVFERDNYTCQACGVRGTQLQADHDLPFQYFPDLRFELLNGRTLCVPCHRKTDTYGRRGAKIYAITYTT